MTNHKELCICICTYNRADLLLKALDSLVHQTADPARFDIMVVDNKSDDHTSEVCKKFQNGHEHVHYYFEEEQGLSHARNQGWKEAITTYVGYFDDDATAPDDYVQKALEVIDEKSPDIFGGQVCADYEVQPPDWLPDGFGNVIPAEESGNLESGKYLTGPSFFVRRELFKRYGGFDTDLGMSGTTVAYGEETELMIRFKEMDDSLNIYYRSDMFVHHLIEKRKMKLSWWAKKEYANKRDLYTYTWQLNEYGNEFGEFVPTTAVRFYLSCIKNLTLLLINLTKGMLFRNRQIHPTLGHYLLDKGFGPLRMLGKNGARLRLSKKKQVN